MSIDPSEMKSSVAAEAADPNARMKELVALLNKASEAYYAKDEEIMSNFEYDKLYDELVSLEKKTGVTLTNSPTVHVGYASVDELPKRRHEKPMLSLDKTKSREELRDWLGDQEGLLSFKLDGLTVVLTYKEGKLFEAVTRGNGEIGARQRRNRRSHYAERESLREYSDFDSVSGRIDPSGRGRHPLFRF